MDLDELRGTLGAESDKVWDDAASSRRSTTSSTRLPKPTIAAVNGAAVAGGAGLVTVCDLALVGPRCEVRLPRGAARAGRGDGDAAPAAARRRASGALAAADRRTDRRRRGPAHAVSINAVVSPEHLLDTADAWAKSLAEGGPKALAETKELLRRFSRQALSVEELAEGQRGTAADRGVPPAGWRRSSTRNPCPWTPQ